ncbi:metallophosphoesterase [Bergeyella sp. RCAD1439]|uniref:metallophosphoesterase n=1 Tax=Bergeyella anatis TaxID=3113737 RepID=UPI002E18F1E2|nr:metallophosphoesterase [Bergeyella sp. RCAD1439]
MKHYFFILIGFIFLLEFYVYQAVKNATTTPLIRYAYIVFNLLVYATLIYNIFLMASEKDHSRIQWITTLFLAFLLPKLLASIVLFIDDLLRWSQYGIAKAGQAPSATLPERRKFLSLMGLGLAGTLSLLFLDGVVFGKYRHKVRKVKLKIKGLPVAFKGYKIIQISDVHSGSFAHPEKLKHAIEAINLQNPDLVLFTGDMVNNTADEFLPFKSLFASIRAKDGKFSVLGNHDYGHYVSWPSKAEESLNLSRLIQYQKEAGFQMLRNEHYTIEKKGQPLHILGVENWGIPPFPQYGDLDKAAKGLPKNTVKILMSHDPTHFDEIVKNHPANIALTLSGHTHGMQFGLDLKNVRWSPVQYRYKKWADLYESNGRYLYVNRGFGVLAYPGRVGISPEITLFELE